MLARDSGDKGHGGGSSTWDEIPSGGGVLSLGRDSELLGGSSGDLP
jgi:hypothetical protein